MIKRSLDHIENLMLHHSRLIADRNDDVSFCELTHNKTKSLIDTEMRGKNSEKVWESYASNVFPKEERRILSAAEANELQQGGSRTGSNSR